MVSEWIEVNGEELAPLGYIDPLAISAQTPGKLPALHAAGGAVLARFFRGVENGRIMCSCAHC